MKRSSFIKSLIGLPLLVEVLGSTDTSKRLEVPSRGGFKMQMDQNANVWWYDPYNRNFTKSNI